MALLSPYNGFNNFPLIKTTLLRLERLL